MPHCILEYSDNVADQPDVRALLLDVHRFLASTNEIDMAKIKSRAICHETYAIGDGTGDQAFITMNICLLSGRDDETKAEISSGVLAILKRAYPQTLATKVCSITVQITDMHRQSYAKAVGPPSP